MIKLKLIHKRSHYYISLVRLLTAAVTVELETCHIFYNLFEIVSFWNSKEIYPKNNHTDGDKIWINP